MCFSLDCIYAYFDVFYFFFNDTATTEIYTLSLHDALPICRRKFISCGRTRIALSSCEFDPARSEEHTSELQSPTNLVCRLLLEKKHRSWPARDCSAERLSMARNLPTGKSIRFLMRRLRISKHRKPSTQARFFF